MANLDVVRVIFPRKSSWKKFVRHVSQTFRNVSTDRRMGLILSIVIEIKMSKCNVLRTIFISDRKGRYGFAVQFALICY